MSPKRSVPPQQSASCRPRWRSARRTTAPGAVLAAAVALLGVLTSACGGSDRSAATTSTTATTPAGTDGGAPTPHAFLDAVRAVDRDPIVASLAEDVELHSPVLEQPFRGRTKVGRLFGILVESFHDVEIVDRIDAGDRQVIAFRATIDDTPIEVVDRVRFDDEGKVVEVVVSTRFIEGTEALAAAVAPHLDELL